jgi:dienelactone hydrolase
MQTACVARRCHFAVKGLLSRTIATRGRSSRLRGNDSNDISRLSLLVALLFSGAAAAEIVQIPASHLGESKTLRAQLFVPEKKSDAPRPAAIMLHGCGGIGAKGELNPRHAMWKDWLVERGFVVLFPESFSSRSVNEICTQKLDARTIKQRDRVNDVFAAREWLVQRADVDAAKLVLWGWSNGGGTVLASIVRNDRTGSAVSDRNPPNKAFAQAISFYPGCTNYASSPRKQTLAAPLALFIGEADDWTPAAPCEMWVERLQEEKQPATIRSYPGAFHDFEPRQGCHRRTRSARARAGEERN